MQEIKDALLKEGKVWLDGSFDRGFGAWCTHVLVETPSHLVAAFQTVSIEDDEEFEDAMDELITEVYDEVMGL